MPQSYGTFLVQTRHWRQRASGIYVPPGGGGPPDPPGGTGGGGAAPGVYADLPTEFVDVSLPSNTGTIRSVASGDVAGLQSAINASVMGDIIELAAGGSWNITGEGLSILNRTWSVGQYVWVRPSNYATLSSTWPLQANGMPTDAQVKVQATNPRMTPTRAVALGLPIIYTNRTNCSTRFKLNCRGWYFQGIDFQLSPSWSPAVYNYGIAGLDADDLAGITNIDQMPSYIIFNQCLVRSPVGVRNAKAAIMNFNYHGFVNSYAESHLIGGENASLWTGIGKGPGRWENNAVVGASITAFIGGQSGYGVGSWHDPHVPSNFVIRHNYLYRPDEWLPGHPLWIYNGITNNNTTNLNQAEDCKNCLELKIGKKILIEENHWSGSGRGSQNGQGLMIKVLNEYYPGGVTSPGIMTWTEVQNVIVRNNLQTRCGDGMDVIGNQQTTGLQHEAYQVNRLHLLHNIFLIPPKSEGYRGTTNRMGLLQAWPSTDAIRGKRVPSWAFEHNTFCSRSGDTFGVGFYLNSPGTAQWDTGWPKFKNNIFAGFPWSAFLMDGAGSSAQALADQMPGVDFDKNIYSKLSASENDFSNVYGNFEGNQHFVNGTAGIGINMLTGELDPGSPARQGGAMESSDGFDNGAYYEQVMDAVAGISFWQ